MSRRVAELFVLVAASAIVVLMVALGGVAIARATDLNCPTLGATACKPDPFIWCRPLNGQTICIREKT